MPIGRSRVGALLVMPVLAILVLGAAVAADAVLHARALGRAQQVARLLPDGYRLGDRLRLEAETIGSGEAGSDTARLGRLRIGTDTQAAAWAARAGHLPTGDDPALAAQVGAVQRQLADLDTLRARIARPGSAEQAWASYASAIAGLGRIGAHLPTQREQDLTRRADGLAEAGEALAALTQERATLAAALAGPAPSSRTVAALASAEAGVDTALAGFEDAASPGVRLKAATVEKARDALAPAVHRLLSTGTATGLRPELVLAQWSTLFSAVTALAADAADELATDLAARSSVVRIRTEVLLALAVGTLVLTGLAWLRTVRRQRPRPLADDDDPGSVPTGRPEELLDTFLAHARGAHAAPAPGVVPIPSPRHVPRHAAWTESA